MLYDMRYLTPNVNGNSAFLSASSATRQRHAGYGTARGLSQTFPDQCTSCTRRRYGPTFGYRVGSKTPPFLPIVTSMQVRQSATPSQIVREKTLRQALTERPLRGLALPHRVHCL